MWGYVTNGAVPKQGYYVATFLEKDSNSEEYILEILLMGADRKSEKKSVAFSKKDGGT